MKALDSLAAELKHDVQQSTSMRRPSEHTYLTHLLKTRDTQLHCQLQEDLYYELMRGQLYWELQDLHVAVKQFEWACPKSIPDPA